METHTAATELVVLNARIRTLDGSCPLASAIATKAGRILALGSTEKVRTIADESLPHATIIDAGGKTMLPGFIDAHTHLLSGGFALQSLDLRGCRNRDEFILRIRDRVNQTAPGEWIRGGGWDEQTWSEPLLPCKEWIDSFSPNHPVFLRRSDLHIGLANSAALRAAGIGSKTADPEGGMIYRDPASNEPTGILKDAAMQLLETVIPKPDRAQQESALTAALRLAARRGVTSVQDITDWGNPTWSEWELFQDFRRNGKLTCRIFARLPLADWELRRNDYPVFQVGENADPWLRFGGLKGFGDGSLGGRTACFFEPYLDDPVNQGLLLTEMLPPEKMERRIRETDQAGFPLSIHAIGDQTLSLLLDHFETVSRQNGPRDRRFRIEHVQHLRSQDIPRLARLGITASIQPAHLLDDGGWAERVLGKERIQWTYAFRSLADAGIVLAGGSDWPVSPLDPLLGIHAAVTRNSPDNRFPGGWQPQQKLTVDEAVAAFTTGAAYAEFAEQEKGSLSVGKFADWVLLSEDPFTCPPENLCQIEVLQTVAGGRVVFQK